MSKPLNHFELEKSCQTLDRMEAPENRVNGFQVGVIFLECKNLRLDAFEMLAKFVTKSRMNSDSCKVV